MFEIKKGDENDVKSECEEVTNKNEDQEI